MVLPLVLPVVTSGVTLGVTLDIKIINANKLMCVDSTNFILTNP